MIKCIVVEDQVPAQRILQKYIKDVEGIELEKIFTNALDALDYLKENTIDLIFLDIHLPKLSGMDFISVLPQKPYIILTTAFSEYAIQGYEFEVIDYLLKPFSFDRFLKAVIKVQRQIEKFQGLPVKENKTNNSILVKVGYDLVKVSFKDILFIKSDGDYTLLQGIEVKYLTSHPLKFWLEKLPDHFLQIHRSFIVNIKYIQKITANTVAIFKHSIPIGRVYKKEFKEKFLNHR